MNKIAVYFSTLFGIGYFPKAPGTAGSLFAALLYLVIPQLKDFYLLFAIIAISLISVFIISSAEKILGHDDGKIVLDELLGYFVAVLFLPKELPIIIIAFILFRIFDIFKPEPVNMLQKLPKGWGVVADDIMAGIYANISLQILLFLK